MSLSATRVARAMRGRPRAARSIAPAATSLWFGWGCIGCFAAHALVQACVGIPHNLLWVCHTACLLTGIGLLMRFTTLARAGLLMLLIGTPMWLISLATGGEFYPTSILTHVGGLVCGWCGQRSIAPRRQVGRSMVARDANRVALRRTSATWSSWRRGWLLAVASVAVLLVVSRGATPPEANVNLAFAPWFTLPDWLSGDEPYMAFLFGVWCGLLWIAAQLLRLLTRLDMRLARDWQNASRNRTATTD